MLPARLPTIKQISVCFGWHREKPNTELLSSSHRHRTWGTFCSDNGTADGFITCMFAQLPVTDWWRSGEAELVLTQSFATAPVSCVKCSSCNNGCEITVILSATQSEEPGLSVLLNMVERSTSLTQVTGRTLQTLTETALTNQHIINVSVHLHLISSSLFSYFTVFLSHTLWARASSACVFSVVTQTCRGNVYIYVCTCVWVGGTVCTSLCVCVISDIYVNVISGVWHLPLRHLPLVSTNVCAFYKIMSKHCSTNIRFDVGVLFP